MSVDMWLKCLMYRNWHYENWFAEINVVCEKDSVRITWRISAELVPHAARLFLGNCMPSRLNVLSSGEGEAHFNYKFADCKFKRGVMSMPHLTKKKTSQPPECIFNNLFFDRWMENVSSIKMNWPTGRIQSPNLQPLSIPSSVFIKGKSAFLNENPVQSQAEMWAEKMFNSRPEGWIPPFLNPGSGVSEGRGGLVFHMALLNGESENYQTQHVDTLRTHLKSFFYLPLQSN